MPKIYFRRVIYAAIFILFLSLTVFFCSTKVQAFVFCAANGCVTSDQNLPGTGIDGVYGGFGRGCADGFVFGPVKSIERVTCRPGGYDDTIAYWYAKPGNWFTPSYGYPPGAGVQFWDNNPGDILEFPNGTKVTVPASGVYMNCIVGMLNSNGCPSRIMVSAYTLTVEKGGSGSGLVTGSGIDCGQDCSTTFRAGSTTIITAIATSSGSRFNGWNGSGGCYGSNPKCSVWMNESKTVKALFGLTGAPTDLKAAISISAPSIGKVDLSWKIDPGVAQKIQVERSFTGKPDDFSKLDEIAGSDLTKYTDTNLATYWLSKLDTGTVYYRVRAIYSDGLYSDYSNVATVKLCVKLSGNGPLNIVFERSRDVAVNDLVSYSNTTISEGFKSIDPFKTFQDKFSFFLDLQAHNDQSDYNYINSMDGSAQSFADAVASVKNLSSCGGSNSQNIFFKNNIGSGFGLFSYTGLGLSYIDLSLVKSGMIDSVPISIGVIHEVAHGFANVLDEYMISSNSRQGAITNNLLTRYLNRPWIYTTANCTSKPSWDYRNPRDNKIYGSVKSVGCSYLAGSNATFKTSSGVYVSPATDFMKNAVTYYRPSSASIMNDTPHNTAAQNKFNVISCGYIVAAIYQVPLTQENASQFWPMCKNLDTIKDGIPAVGSAPRFTVPVNIPAVPGKDMTVTGSGFSAEGNKVQFILKALKISQANSSDQLAASNSSSIFGKLMKALATALRISNPGTDNTASVINVTSTSTPNSIYEVDATASADGRSLTFKIPETMPAGIYEMKIGAFNSDWSSSVNISVLGLPPVANLMVDGVQARSYNVGDAVHWSWSSSNADTFTTSYSFANDASCLSKGLTGSWNVLKTASGTYTIIVPEAYRGCTWTEVYTASNSKTGQSATARATVSVPAASMPPTARLSVDGLSSRTYNVGDTVHWFWTSGNADTFTTSFSFANDASCSSRGTTGSWSVLKTAGGTYNALIPEAYRGCTWTQVYTASNSKTGQSVTVRATIKVPVSSTGGPVASPTATVSPTPSPSVSSSNPSSSPSPSPAAVPSSVPTPSNTPVASPSPSPTPSPSYIPVSSDQPTASESPSPSAVNYRNYTANVLGNIWNWLNSLFGW